MYSKHFTKLAFGLKQASEWVIVLTNAVPYSNALAMHNHMGYKCTFIVVISHVIIFSHYC